MRKILYKYHSYNLTSKDSCDLEDTHFVFHLYAPYWMVKACKEFLKKFIKSQESR